MGCSASFPDWGVGELALLSITLSYTASAPSGWGKERCHEVFKCFRLYPVVSVPIPTWEPVFKLKHGLGKMLTALNRWGWEVQPSAILIGVHLVSCFIFPKQVLGTVALFLEMRIWIAFPGTKCLLWSLEVKTLCFFLWPVPALRRTKWKVYLFCFSSWP